MAKRTTEKQAGTKGATTRKPNPALMKPLQPSKELAAVVGSAPLPRPEVVSRVWDYIKKNNLQNPENRREILAEHTTYQKGWLYFVANDPRVPEDVRKAMSKWGLPKDEFVDNGGWSHQIYVREARRLIGRYVMTENELQKRRPTPESIGMGSYTIDSHNVQRYITPAGHVQNEGDIGVGTKRNQRLVAEAHFGRHAPRHARERDRVSVARQAIEGRAVAGSKRFQSIQRIVGSEHFGIELDRRMRRVHPGTAACAFLGRT